MIDDNSNRSVVEDASKRKEYVRVLQIARSLNVDNLGKSSNGSIDIEYMAIVSPGEADLITV